MPKSPRIPLSPDDILEAEYKYIADTAFQAHEDRARVTSFYFVAVGSLVAAILSAQFAGGMATGASLAFSLLFAILTALGALTLAQLARLRAAWHESVEAMNQIKDFYLQHQPGLGSAFKWSGKTIPPADKPYSIANLMAAEVTLLSALTASAALYFLLRGLGAVTWLGWLFLALFFGVGCLTHWIWYRHLLTQG